MSQGQLPTDYSLLSLFHFLLAKYKWVIGIPFAVGLATAIWMLNTENVYKAEALLAISNEASGGGLNSIAGQLGGLASLAGINVGGDGDSKVQVALAILESRKFAKQFISDYEMAIPLFAGAGWDQESKQLVIDPDIYDTETGSWVRDVGPGKTASPTDLELYSKYREMLEITEDKPNGLVTIAVEHFDPALASIWANTLVEELNAEMRSREVVMAQQNISYLENQLESLENVDMRSVFFQLIEEQTKNLMLAEVKQDFVFSSIDPAVVPERPDSPKRTLICLLAIFLSGFLVVIVLTIWFLMRPAAST